MEATKGGKSGGKAGARSKGYGKNSEGCWDCGDPGHKSDSCPYMKHSAKDKGKGKTAAQNNQQEHHQERHPTKGKGKGVQKGKSVKDERTFLEVAKMSRAASKKEIEDSWMCKQCFTTNPQDKKKCAGCQAKDSGAADRNPVPKEEPQEKPLVSSHIPDILQGNSEEAKQRLIKEKLENERLLSMVVDSKETADFLRN